MEEQKHYVFEKDKRMTLKNLLMQFGLKGGDQTTIVVENGNNEMVTCRRYLESAPMRYLLDTKVTDVILPYITFGGVKTIKFILES